MSFLPVRVSAARPLPPRRRPPSGNVVSGTEAVAGKFRPRLFALFRFRGHRLGLGYPAIGAGRKPDLFADLVRRVVIEFGELPVVEDAEIVELLLDRTGHAGELLEVVGCTARTGKTLEAGRLRRRRDFLADRLRGSA